MDSRNQRDSIVILDVPYKEKDEAKGMGAKWDPRIRRWYVPEGVDPARFERWLEVEEEKTGS